MYNIQLNERVIGYCASSARSGETISVKVSGATSTEDGDLHIKYLEGIPQNILAMIDMDIKPCDVKNMVVLISKDLKARVYINELDVCGYVFVKAKNVEKGQVVTKDDFSGFEKIKIGDLEFPDDHAFFCILSLGWDRAYIFDFSPLDERENSKIDYDVEKRIGAYFSYLSFKTIHKISNLDWEELLRQNWFPFYALKFSTAESMISYARDGWDIDEIIDVIEAEALSYLDERLLTWAENEALSIFVDFLHRAIERHKSSDFVSSSSIIYPKIEALIRQDFIKDNPNKEGRRSSILVEHVTEKTVRNISTLTIYIPDKFKRYLEECYFKDFSASGQDNQVSRHSVAHGASSIDHYNKKASIVGLLVFSQISEYLQQSSKK